MDLQCRRCHKPIASGDINVQQLIAKCGACGAVFTFGATEAAAEGTQRATRGAIPMPARWKMQREGGVLVFSHRWFRPLFIFLAFFGLLWNSFLFQWYHVAFGLTSEQSFSALSILFVVLPLLHVAAGLALTYFTLAGFLNTTTISVDHVSIRVRHFPLPWLHAGSINNSDLDQLYCKESRQESKGQTYYRYKLCALLRNGRERVLLSNMDSPDQALYLESELEKALGITDKPVAGEYKG
jgi:hypothetical protein